VSELCFGSESGCVLGNSTANEEAAGDVDRVVKKSTVMKNAAATRARRKLSIVPPLLFRRRRGQQLPRCFFIVGCPRGGLRQGGCGPKAEWDLRSAPREGLVRCWAEGIVRERNGGATGRDVRLKVKFKKEKKGKGGGVAQRVSKEKHRDGSVRDVAPWLLDREAGITQRAKIRMGRGAIRELLIMPRNLAEGGFDSVLSDNFKSKEGRRSVPRICSSPREATAESLATTSGPAQSGSTLSVSQFDRPFRRAHRGARPWVD
jgi:hypothetical protein